MSPKRKRLDWQTATSPGFYLHPLADYRALKDRLGAPPTTGAMMIDLIARSRMARLDLHGFDFFASQSLSGRRSAADVPHDFNAEARWVAGLQRSDPGYGWRAPDLTAPDPSRDEIPPFPAESTADQGTPGPQPPHASDLTGEYTNTSSFRRIFAVISVKSPICCFRFPRSCPISQRPL